MKSRLAGLMWVIGAVVLGGGGVALGGALRVLPEALPRVLSGLVVIGLGLVVEAAFFLWTFWMLGDRRVGPRALVPGAIVGAAGFELLKIGATVYLPELIANSSSLYGPLGIVFAILAWMALFARLLVYASALNAVLYERAAGTATLTVPAPRLPGPDASSADRGGAIIEPDPA